MKPALPGLALLAALLVVPFALRPPQLTDDEDAPRLVVLTPHNEAIRYEITRGFKRHLAAQQRNVRIDWRSPGGTTEIARYLASEFRSAFEAEWRTKQGKPLSEAGARAFVNPKQSSEGESEPARARRAFLASKVGVKIDVLFGGGSYDFSQHAAAGRLVDSGVLRERPELFGGKHGIPQTVGGEPYWDKQGRWVGVCVSGFGICYNQEALGRLGITRPPTAWADLADPRLAGHLALADPSKAGSANKAFEMILQQEMAAALARRGSPTADSAAEGEALAEGFATGLRLIRKLGGSSRYFSDQAGKVAQDVQSGAAAAGMCIDFYGRFQSDTVAGGRLGFVLPAGGSSLGSDPIGLLRGAPEPELGRELIEFVLSPAGQALWSFRRGVPGGPERYALRRLPILPASYAPALLPLRSDPGDNPYQVARTFTYHPDWTAPLFRALSFVIRVMCVDSEVELHEAAAELERYGHPPRAQASFDDVSLFSYQVIKREIAPALASGDPLREVALQNRLVREVKAQYERISELARGRR